MRSLLRPLALLGIGLVVPAAHGDERRADTPPFESEGDLRFFVDLTGYRGPDRRTDEEIELSVTSALDEILDRIKEDSVGKADQEIDPSVTNGLEEILDEVGSFGTTAVEIYLSITNDEFAFEEIQEDSLYEGELRLVITDVDKEVKKRDPIRLPPAARLDAPLDEWADDMTELIAIGADSILGRIRGAHSDAELEADHALFRIETTLKPRALSRLDTEDRGIIQVIRETVMLPPGIQRFEIALYDQKTLKTGLFNQMRNKKRGGRVVAYYDVPDYSGNALQLSEPVLLRKFERVQNSPFGRNGVDFDPNPSRLYGLLLPSVSVYAEVYAGAAFQAGDTLLVRTQVLDRAEVPVKERIRRATPVRDTFEITDALDLSDVSAGSYLFDVTVRNKRTLEQVNVRRPFEVIWTIDSWAQNPESVLTEMRLIMSDSDFKTLQKLAPGAREVFLEQWWNDLDPTPHTPENEVLAAFRERVRKADIEFASTLQRGIVTDRGRVYVRYGPPDETDFQYSSSSIGGDLGAERVADPGERASLGSRPNRSFLDADQFQEGDISGVVDQRGGANVESKSLVIWTYDAQGYVLTDQRDLDSTSHRGLKFIFADEMGDGNYVLIGSSGTTLY